MEYRGQHGGDGVEWGYGCMVGTTGVAPIPTRQSSDVIVWYIAKNDVSSTTDGYPSQSGTTVYV